MPEAPQCLWESFIEISMVGIEHGRQKNLAKAVEKVLTLEKYPAKIDSAFYTSDESPQQNGEWCATVLVISVREFKGPILHAMLSAILDNWAARNQDVVLNCSVSLPLNQRPLPLRLFGDRLLYKLGA